VSAPDPTLRFRRQLDLLPLDKLGVPITVIGAGAVGSFAILTLAKMGFRNLTVHDDDSVTESNISAQFYRLADLGQPKAAALADLVQSFEGIDIRAVPQRFDGGRLSGIVVGAVDSMASRRVVWNAVRFDPEVRLLICSRMGGMVSTVRAVRPCDPGDVRRYAATLHSDDEACQESCTGRSILFNVLSVASLIAENVRKEVLGRDLPREVTRDHELGLLLTS
jgi:hypothetical protein